MSDPNVVTGGDRTSSLAALRAFFPFVRPHWRGFVPAILGVVGSSLVGMLEPWPLKFLIDDVLRVRADRAGTSATVLLAAVGASIVGIAALRGLVSYVKDFFLTATAQRVAFRIRCALFGRIQRLPLAFHDRQRTGDMITRVTNDVTKVQELITDDVVVKGTTSVIQLVGMLAVMIAIDWSLGLIAAMTAPLIALTAAHFRGRIRSEERRVRAGEGDIASLAQETISSIRVVKSFGREGFETKRFEDKTAQMLDAGIRVTRLEARYSWALNVVTALGLAALVGDRKSVV